jgi:hypothetical protein
MPQPRTAPAHAAFHVLGGTGRLVVAVVPQERKRAA